MRPGKAKRSQFAGGARIGRLPHAAEHRAAGELRFLALRVVHAAEHFAGERIERLPRAVGGLVEHGDDERIGDRPAIEGRRNRILIPRLRHAGKSEAGAGRAGACRATARTAICPATTCVTTTSPVSDQRQHHIVGGIAERRREEGEIAGDIA